MRLAMNGALTRYDLGGDLALAAAKAALAESRRRGYPRFAVAVTNRAGADYRHPARIAGYDVAGR